MSWILEHYTQAKIDIQKSLEGAGSVHFSFDIWSSPNHRAFLGIVAHRVGAAGSLHGLLLGLRRFHGPHTGSNLAGNFWCAAEEFQITRKIGYFTLDNATNNDSAVVEISSLLSNIGVAFFGLQG